MGSVKTIDYDKTPKQGCNINRRTKVCFHYDTRNIVWGRIVRQDIEEPFETLILLDNGFIVRAVECQYSPI